MRLGDIILAEPIRQRLLEPAKSFAPRIFDWGSQAPPGFDQQPLIRAASAVRLRTPKTEARQTNKPFVVWYTPARMHVTTVLSDKYMAMVGEPGGKDWGVNEAGMKQLDDNIGLVLKKLEDMGQLDNTLIVF